MAQESTDIWERLRHPFPAGTVGKLPKPYKSDSPKGTCQECGGYHGLPAMHLDYVGHANVTDRLNHVDPTWTWEPVAFDERGLPQYDLNGGLWIRLTIGGVTRLGYGDGPDPKQRIGDAIRNAAMRFGVALDLWTKDELESQIDHPELKNQKPTAAPQPLKAELVPPALMQDLRVALTVAGLTGENASGYCTTIIGKDKPTNSAEVKRLLTALDQAETNAKEIS